MKSIRFGQDLYLPEFGARDLELLVAATQNNESQESKSNEKNWKTYINEFGACQGFTFLIIEDLKVSLRQNAHLVVFLAAVELHLVSLLALRLIRHFFVWLFKKFNSIHFTFMHKLVFQLRDRKVARVDIHLLRCWNKWIDSQLKWLVQHLRQYSLQQEARGVEAGVSVDLNQRQI